MLEVEWDPQKAAENEQKHGVTFEEAASALADSLSLTIFDPDHSETEDRYLLLGVSSLNRLIVVSHTERDDRIRIISARIAHPRERRQYEESS